MNVLLLVLVCLPLFSFASETDLKIAQGQAIGENQTCWKTPEWNIIKDEELLQIFVVPKTSDCSTKNFILKIDGDSTFYAGHFKNFLFLDEGTSDSSRSLYVYDLKTKKRVIDEAYSHYFIVLNDQVELWSPIEKDLPPEMCPNKDEIIRGIEQGFGHQWNKKIIINLKSLIKTEKQETLCTVVS